MQTIKVRDAEFFRQMLVGSARHVGQGLYANTYVEKGGDNVIKVFRDDPAYAAFQAMTLVPEFKCVHWPVIHDPVTRVIDGKGNEFHFTRMERLYPSVQAAADAYEDVKRLKNRIASDRSKSCEGPLRGEWDRVAVGLWHLFRTEPLGMDLHDGNWMVRRDGTPVITDPVVWCG